MKTTYFQLQESATKRVAVEAEYRVHIPSETKCYQSFLLTNPTGFVLI